MKTSVLVIEETFNTVNSEYVESITPINKPNLSKFLEVFSFDATDVSTQYNSVATSAINIAHKLILRELEAMVLVDVSVQGPETDPEAPEYDPEAEPNPPIWEERYEIFNAINSDIAIEHKLIAIDGYYIENNITYVEPTGEYEPTSTPDEYPDIYESFIAYNPEPIETFSIDESMSTTIIENPIEYTGNIGPMIRLNHQSRLFEEYLSLENCISILDSSDIIVGGLSIIYSFEVFVEFGRAYPDIAEVSLDLVDSIGFVDAYPFNPLNSLKFDESTGIISGTINFLDKTLYIIELENKSAIAAILNPRLPLPL